MCSAGRIKDPLHALFVAKSFQSCFNFQFWLLSLINSFNSLLWWGAKSMFWDLNLLICPLLQRKPLSALVCVERTGYIKINSASKHHSILHCASLFCQNNKVMHQEKFWQVCSFLYIILQRHISAWYTVSEEHMVSAIKLYSLCMIFKKSWLFSAKVTECVSSSDIDILNLPIITYLATCILLEFLQCWCGYVQLGNWTLVLCRVPVSSGSLCVWQFFYLFIYLLFYDGLPRQGYPWKLSF